MKYLVNFIANVLMNILPHMYLKRPGCGCSWGRHHCHVCLLGTKRNKPGRAMRDIHGILVSITKTHGLHIGLSYDFSAGHDNGGDNDGDDDNDDY